MDRLLVMARALPPGATWLFASAILALLGAANACLHGLAQVGVVGAIVAVAVVWGFCDWTQTPLIDRR